MQFTVWLYLSFYLHTALAHGYKETKQLGANLSYFSLLVVKVNVDLWLTNRESERRGAKKLPLLFSLCAQGDIRFNTLAAEFDGARAAAATERAALIQQLAKDLTHHPGVREDK